MCKRTIVLMLISVLLISSLCYADTYNDLIRIGLTREQRSNNIITVSFDGPHYIGTSDSLGSQDYYVPINNSYTFSLTAGELTVNDDITKEIINSETVEKHEATDTAETSTESSGAEGTDLNLKLDEIMLKTGDVLRFNLKETTLLASDKTTMTINGNEYATGFMLAQNSSGSLVPINLAERQDYLKGVVPKEIPASWHIEALKAQAVAARTYSVSQTNRHKDNGYDVCDNTHCQVYGGKSSYYESSSRAVDETDGQILTYDGQPIVAYFHSSSGGYIENSEDVFLSRLDYIRAAYDPFSEAHEGVNWQKKYTKSELTTFFNNKGYNLGTIQTITIENKLKSGRVKTLKIWGSKNVLELQSNDIRKVFGYTNLKSTLFTIDTKTVYNVLSNDNQQQMDKSNIFVISGDGKVTTPSSQLYVKQDFGQKPLITQSQDIVFNGKGSGHGLGMSQYGASTMANQGANYKDILAFYYPYATLEN